MPILSTDSYIGFAAGALATTGVYLCYQAYRDWHPPCKSSHPREWAIWRRIDRKSKGVVSKQDIKSLCYRFHSDEHAEILASVLDKYGTDRITFDSVVAKFPYVQMMRKAARLKLWHRCCGIGVGGNVAGHMAQAGEAGPESKAATKPTAIFMYYTPPKAFVEHDKHVQKKRLETFPVTYACIDFPQLPGAMKVQVEPELGLYADIVYSLDRKKVQYLVPRRVAAFNDCSIRVLDGATKLNQKKNWGFGSKGISLRSFEIDSFAPGSFVDSLVIVSYLKRDGETHQYSVNAPCRNYLMFNEPLLEWIVQSINEQQDHDKWEAIFPMLEETDFPTSTWIACGAGEYTEWGSTNYIKVGDEVAIFLYDETKFPDGPTVQVIQDVFDDLPAPEGMVDLHQTFCAAQQL